MRIGIIATVLILLTVFGYHAVSKEKTEAPKEEESEHIIHIPEPEDPFARYEVEVVEGSTFGTLMEKEGVPASVINAILTAAKDSYDFSRIRLGRNIVMTREKETGSVIELSYAIDSEEEVIVRNDGGAWEAERRNIPYESRERLARGVIESSMYMAGINAGIDERAIIAVADVFQWAVDFAMDVREGDEFSMIFDERYLDGVMMGPGSVHAAKFVNNGKVYYAFRFVDPNGDVGFYDEEGNATRKLFLKAPLEYRYISSGFTTGLRYVSAFNVSTGHRAIDYAAATGTPIRAVGDGVISFSGWNGPYGNMVSVRHNGTYSTNYAHMSRRAVNVGQRVSQGTIIGYVGSTGFSTGPHLHYEMVKNGVKINPLLETFPAGKALTTELRSLYTDFMQPLKERLDENN